MSTDWFDPVALEGPTLRLSPLTLADATHYRTALGGAEDAAEVVAHLSLSAPATDADAAAIIAGALADPKRVAYAQRLRADDRLVGTTSFYDIEPSVRALAIGHTWLARRWWQTHVNTESKLLMLSRAFDGLGAERVVWHTDIRNLRSQAAIERLGAHREGVLRHHRIRLDGSWRDTVQFSMLAAEWPAVRERLADRSTVRSAVRS